MTWGTASKEYIRNYMKVWRDKNRQYTRDAGKKTREKNKLLALSYYSNDQLRCACCGENYYGCLTIDHIGGDGAKHKHELTHNGTSLYTWLKHNNYPQGFQVLCMNCNWVKGVSDGCKMHNKC